MEVKLKASSDDIRGLINGHVEKIELAFMHPEKVNGGVVNVAGFITAHMESITALNRLLPERDRVKVVLSDHNHVPVGVGSIPDFKEKGERFLLRGLMVEIMSRNDDGSGRVRRVSSRQIEREVDDAYVALKVQAKAVPIPAAEMPPYKAVGDLFLHKGRWLAIQSVNPDGSGVAEPCQPPRAAEPWSA